MAITGIIKPPPDIRAVVHKTAQFVAKNGRAFETKILAREEGKSMKFSFLEASSPFHAYYEDRVLFYENDGESKTVVVTEAKGSNEKEGAVVAVASTVVAQSGEAVQVVSKKEHKASAIDVVAKMLLAQREKIKSAYSAKVVPSEESKDGSKAESAPETKDEKSSDETDGTTTTSQNNAPIKPRDMVFVTVTAPIGLTQMEIDTIKLVAQFTALASNVRTLGGGFLDSVMRKEWQNPTFSFLQPMNQHFAYFSALVDNYKKIIKRNEEHESFIKNCAYGGAAGFCLEEAAYRCEYNRDIEERKREEEEKLNGNGALGGSALVDWHDFVIVETINFPYDEVVGAIPAIPIPAPTPVQSKQVEVNDDMDMDESDEEEEKIRVVPNYTPKVVEASSAMEETSRTHMIDPITGQTIRLADMSEHMRIQLLDPKWAEERRRFLDKQKESNFVAGDAIASNISRLAQQRQDIFGSSAEDKALRDTNSKKRLEEANKLLQHQSVQSQAAKPTTSQPVIPPSGTYPTPPVQISNLSAPPLPKGFGAPSTGFAAFPPLPPQVQDAASTEVTLPLSGIAHNRPDIDTPEAKKARLDFPAGLVGFLPPPPPPPGQTNVQASSSTVNGSSDDAKKILTEAEFAASLPSRNVKLTISIPADNNYIQWQFKGQILSVDVEVTAKIKSIKEMIQIDLGGMPTNKMQLKSIEGGVFLKDSNTLASLNMGPFAALELVPKVRGGRK